MQIEEIVEAVKRHALENYNSGGWDYIVECWTDKELAAEITERGFTTAEEALEDFGKTASLLAERRTEICNA